LQECKRVLKKGAVLRIVVPDVEKFIIAYATNDKTFWKVLGYDPENLPQGFDTKIAVLNHIFRQDGEHKYAYDFEGLSYLLKKYGFNNITRQEYNKSLDEQMGGDQENHRGHSLYVDCIK